MSWVSGELVGVLAFLLPGFVAGAIYHALTSHPKPSAFERVIQALIFTAVVQTIATLLPLPSSVHVMEVPLGKGVTWDPLWSTGIAVGVALIVVVVVNKDVAHRFLRWLQLTRETSHSSEWYSAFAAYETYVVLHLTGNRRLLGWPAEWPSDPARGHFRITQGVWLTDEGRQPLQGVAAILIPMTDVEMVEFLEPEDSERVKGVFPWLRPRRFRPRA